MFDFIYLLAEFVKLLRGSDFASILYAYLCLANMESICIYPIMLYATIT